MNNADYFKLDRWQLTVAPYKKIPTTDVVSPKTPSPSLADLHKPETQPGVEAMSTYALRRSMSLPPLQHTAESVQMRMLKRSNTLPSTPKREPFTLKPNLKKQPNSGLTSLFSALNPIATKKKLEKIKKTADDFIKSELPYKVLNNYMSFGLDARIALEFHVGRENNPDNFDGQLYNKWYYLKKGTEIMATEDWTNLADKVYVECNGEKITERLKDKETAAVLFLNIPSYSGGKNPWKEAAPDELNNWGEKLHVQKPDDGIIEVIGFTVIELKTLHVGIHGHRIAQCNSAKIINFEPMPMQVDGEPVKLLPSVIDITLKQEKGQMLAKKKNDQINVR